MATEFWVFDRYLDGLMHTLSAGQRRVFFSRLGKELAQINKARIKANTTPDGQAYAPRKTQLRNKKGRTRAMFKKLPNSLNTQATDSGVELSFSGYADRIAQVHHYGQEDTPFPKRPHLRVRYTERQLIGLSQSDLELITQRLIQQISKISI